MAVFDLSGKPFSGYPSCCFILGKRHDRPVTKQRNSLPVSLMFHSCTVFVPYCIVLARIMHAFECINRKQPLAIDSEKAIIISGRKLMISGTIRETDL